MVQRVNRLARADLILVTAVAAWSVWVVASTLRSGTPLGWTSAYLTAPVWLLLGVVLGRLLRAARPDWVAPAVLALAGVVALVVPMYPNAQAALGVQLVALAALVLLPVPDPRRRKRAGTSWAPTLAALAVVVGVLLALRSDAAVVLVAVVGVVALLALRFGVAPRRAVVAAIGGVVLAWAAVVVMWLGSRESWPAWLNENTWLSSSRHTLWGDALALWRQHPVAGAGPGAFTASSELASSTPDLALAHSSVLQIGAELGLVGVLLFTALVAGAIAVACNGSRRAALIAVAAWASLGVHSTIDHLFEFPALVLAAGAVLGWASRTRTPAARDSA